MKHDEKWEQTFALLQEYYTEYGAFPNTDKIYQDVKLGKWCANQKLLVKAGKCSEERLTKLQGCGLLETTRDAKWEQNYMLMKKFLAEYRRFPKREEVYEGVQLGIWYTEQKRKRNMERYSAERLQKLEDIGIV